MESLRQWNRKEKCRMFANAEKLYPAVFVPEDSSIENDIDLSDLCDFGSSTNEISNTNESLTFVAIDSLKYSVFAERLGIDLTLMANMSAVVILSEKVSKKTIRILRVACHCIKGQIGTFGRTMIKNYI